MLIVMRTRDDDDDCSSHLDDHLIHRYELYIAAVSYINSNTDLLRCKPDKLQVIVVGRNMLLISGRQLPLHFPLNTELTQPYLRVQLHTVDKVRRVRCFTGKWLSSVGRHNVKWEVTVDISY